jgi:SAM-dependent methyltransferase
MDTSWNVVADKYNTLVGEKGQYYHESVIFPKVHELLRIKSGESILDLGCGQGVFARTLEYGIRYVGFDLAAGLIEHAKNYTYTCDAKFYLEDITRSPKFDELSNHKFDYAISILAIQNVEDFQSVVKNVDSVLKTNGKFLIVLNHPAFRIPKYSNWETDTQANIQYRTIDKYMSPLKIPIDMAPGGNNSKFQISNSKEKQTISFHNPIQYYIKALTSNGFVITDFDELCSDKQSSGKAAEMENNARNEIPLFLAILAEKR